MVQMRLGPDVGESEGLDVRFARLKVEELEHRLAGHERGAAPGLAAHRLLDDHVVSLALPRYSSVDICAEKLRYAITHAHLMDADFLLRQADGWEAMSP